MTGADNELCWCNAKIDIGKQNAHSTTQQMAVTYSYTVTYPYPGSKVHVASMGPTWVLSAMP